MNITALLLYNYLQRSLLIRASTEFYILANLKTVLLYHSVSAIQVKRNHAVKGALRPDSWPLAKFMLFSSRSILHSYTTCMRMKREVVPSSNFGMCASGEAQL